MSDWTDEEIEAAKRMADHVYAEIRYLEMQPDDAWREFVQLARVALAGVHETIGGRDAD
jgi:hypothetical protein